jgi:hypothetical protein
MCVVLQGHHEFKAVGDGDCSAEPSSVALVIDFGVLSSDGSARLKSSIIVQPDLRCGNGSR